MYAGRLLRQSLGRPLVIPKAIFLTTWNMMKSDRYCMLQRELKHRTSTFCNAMQPAVTASIATTGTYLVIFKGEISNTMQQSEGNLLKLISRWQFVFKNIISLQITIAPFWYQQLSVRTIDHAVSKMNVKWPIPFKIHTPLFRGYMFLRSTPLRNSSLKNINPEEFPPEFC